MDRCPVMSDTRQGLDAPITNRVLNPNFLAESEIARIRMQSKQPDPDKPFFLNDLNHVWVFFFKKSDQ